MFVFLNGFSVKDCRKEILPSYSSLFLICLSSIRLRGDSTIWLSYTLLLRLLPTLINLLLQILTKYSLGFVCIWFKTATITEKKLKPFGIILQLIFVCFLSLEDDPPAELSVLSLWPYKYFSICYKLETTAADVVQKALVLQPSGFLQLMNFWILQCAECSQHSTKPQKGRERATSLSYDSDYFSNSSLDH